MVSIKKNQRTSEPVGVGFVLLEPYRGEPTLFFFSLISFNWDVGSFVMYDQIKLEKQGKVHEVHSVVIAA
jgi:hypothetical protein